jgi:hypothetical protein
MDDPFLRVIHTLWFTKYKKVMYFAIVFLLGSVALFVAPMNSGFIAIFVAVLTVYVLSKALYALQMLANYFRLSKVARLIAISIVVLVTVGTCLTSNFLSYRFVENRINNSENKESDFQPPESP